MTPTHETLLARLEAEARRTRELEARLGLAQVVLEQFRTEFGEREAQLEEVFTGFQALAPYFKLWHQGQSELLQKKAKISSLHHRLAKREETIRFLRNLCDGLAKGIPLTFGFHKAKRRYRRWSSRNAPLKSSTPPVPRENAPDTLESDRRKTLALVKKAEAVETQMEKLFLNLNWAIADFRKLCALIGGSGEATAAPQPVGEPLVSIIIPARDHLVYTIRCLRSLAAAPDKTPYEVIVVDDDSAPETVAMLERWPSIRLIRNPVNLGALRSFNAGAAVARGRYLAFLNNDTQVTPGWLDSLVETFEEHPEAGLVGSKMLFPDGTLQEAGGIVWNDGGASHYGRNDDPEKPEYNYFRPTDYCSTSCAMVPRALFEALGGFDERYVPGYYEDTSLAFAVREKGRVVYYQPRSVVIHFEGITNGTDLSSGTKHYQSIHRETFRNHWKTALEADHFPPRTALFHARDRSAKKKLMVVIDHGVPALDKDAGSRSTLHYIRLFCRLGFNVKFIGAGFAAPQPYTRALEALGVEVLHGDEHRRGMARWFEQQGEAVDYVFTNRSRTTAGFLDYFKSLKKAKIFYYGHDLASLRQERLFALNRDPATRQLAGESAALERRIGEAVDVIFHPSFCETARVREAMPRADARTLPLYLLEPRPPADGADGRDMAARTELLFIGGFRHLPNEDGVLWFARHCWPEIRSALPEARFRILGSHVPPSIEQLAGTEGILVTGWVAEEELPTRYAAARVAIVPLRYGAGVKGKVVEAIHHRVPAVLTSVAAEGLPGIESLFPVVDGADAGAFARAVIGLYRDTARCADIASRCDDYLRENFSEARAIEALGFQEFASPIIT